MCIRDRVWACEVINYGPNKGKRKEGDRILIMEDKDGDGKMDEVKTFYQGNDVNAAMGLCVLSDRVIVSVTPNVWCFSMMMVTTEPIEKNYYLPEMGPSAMTTPIIH